MSEESYRRGFAGECLREALSSTSEYAELFLSNPLYAETSGLCPCIDYRPQWGNNGEVPINLGCYYTTQQSNGKAWFGTTGGSVGGSAEEFGYRSISRVVSLLARSANTLLSNAAWGS